MYLKFVLQRIEILDHSVAVSLITDCTITMLYVFILFNGFPKQFVACYAAWYLQFFSNDNGTRMLATNSPNFPCPLSNWLTMLNEEHPVMVYRKRRDSTQKVIHRLLKQCIMTTSDVRWSMNFPCTNLSFDFHTEINYKNWIWNRS